MLTLCLSLFEDGVFDDIELVGHGILFEIDHNVDTIENTRKQLLDPQFNFIKALRKEKRFDRVIIHDGMPSYAEIDGTTQNGRKYTRKLKF